MAKRIATSSVNWALLSEKAIPHVDEKTYIAFKAKADRFLRQVAQYPSESPKIDWSYYKARISKPGVLEAIQKGYEGLKVPYPTDQGYMAKIDQQEAKFKQGLQDHIKMVEKQVAELEVELKKLKDRLPYSEMCYEEYYVNNPSAAIDHDKPEIAFPHPK